MRTAVRCLVAAMTITPLLHAPPDSWATEPICPPGACRLALQPLGNVSAEEIEAVVEGLSAEYGMEVEVLEPVELPDEAYYEPRHRWRAERLLEYLTGQLPPGFDRIMGVTARDISTTKGEHEDWGILGLADLPGVASVVSSYRCRRRVREVSPLERLRRVAIHELGHSLGLPHCPTAGCYMQDAEGTVETIDGETFLCDVCRARLAR